MVALFYKLNKLEVFVGYKMLIEFSVQNYRSIKDRLTLSMVASNKSFKNFFELQSPNNFKTLRTSVIYGSNAAGKSNVIKAFENMRHQVLESGNNVGNSLSVNPFLFEKNSRTKPTEFEIFFIVDEIRYQYGFSFDSERVIEETLIAFPKGRAQRWFSRVYDFENSKYEYRFSENLLGHKSVWQSSTREKALFLSTAVQLNSQQLKPIFDWFKNKLVVTDRHGWGDDFSRIMCSDLEQKNKIIDFLKSADIAIQDIKIDKKKFDIEQLPKDIPEEFKMKIMSDLEDQLILDVKTVHHCSDGSSVHLRLEEESEGTKKLFSISGPLIDSLEDGNVLIIDELHESLHPKIVSFIVDIFNNEKTNPNNAQLIFTTHDTSILNEDVFTPDQVWFCDKNESQETSLYSLSEFKVRKGRSNFEAGYLSGRFGAVPYVSPYGSIKMEF